MAVINVLFLCTHNSARSVLAEVTLNALGEGKFRAFSAGSHPSGRVNPMAIECLSKLGYEVSEVRSKSWDEFAAPGAPPMDIVITVCGDAADEVCPIWPGAPVKAHWGLPDPSRALGSDDDRRRAFALTQRALAERISKLVTLPEKCPDVARWSGLLAQIHENCAIPDFNPANAGEQ